MIGDTTIDLEERRFGNRLQLCKIINELQLKHVEKELEKLRDVENKTNRFEMSKESANHYSYDNKHSRKNKLET